ncbi:LysR substrate-binding domain-containing protein [Acidisarcina polymorpha]|nr:LysR substrate-binding domain-containing protein [Acidisarcina polymorpha]
MEIANIELRHLRYFVAVAEQESVSRAAKRLHVSQPPLSRQIRDLEAELGVALFVRDSRRLILTGPGEVFLSEARAVLQRFDDALVLTREFAKRDGIRIRVGHSSAASVEALPRILRAFQNLHPEAKIELRTMTTSQMIKLTNRGELDICLTIGEINPGLKDFAVEEIGSYGMLAGVPRQHPLARLDKIPLGDLAHEPIISVTLSDFQWYNGYVSRLLTPYNNSFKVAEEHDRAEGVIASVEAGRGVALFYDVLARTIGERLVLREVTPTPPRAPLVLFFRDDRRTPLTASFVKAAHVLRAI